MSFLTFFEGVNCIIWWFCGQTYFMTGGLPPISFSWRHAPWDSRPIFFSQLNTCGHSSYVTSSLKRGVPRVLWPHFTVSDSRLPQPGGPDPRSYIPQEQGGPIIPPGTGFHFRRLLRLVGLRWRYSTPPPHGISALEVLWEHKYPLHPPRIEITVQGSMKFCYALQFMDLTHQIQIFNMWYAYMYT
jgi:hypothetical protein